FEEKNMSKQLIAFHGKPEIKDFYLTRVRAHKAADEIIHGKYWISGKGCAVGCTIHSGDHGAYETEMGIPRILARLEDGIFESLSNGRAKDWPEQFLSAITPGSDLSGVWPRFAVWLLVDEKYGVIQFAKKEAAKKAIQDVAGAYQQVIDGTAAQIEWMKLRRAAAYAAYAAADAYAAYAAAYAADAADAAYAAYAAAATYAAYAAADAADAAYAKRQEWRNAQADKLLELMAAAPVAALM